MGSQVVLKFDMKGGRLMVVCPHCKTEQELVENDRRAALHRDGYDIDRHGTVTPEWVCMARPNGAYCKYSAWIQLRDY